MAFSPSSIIYTRDGVPCSTVMWVDGVMVICVASVAFTWEGEAFVMCVASAATPAAMANVKAIQPVSINLREPCIDHPSGGSGAVAVDDWPKIHSSPRAAFVGHLPVHCDHGILSSYFLFV